VDRVDYDVVAPTFDKRYDDQRYDEVERAIERFVGTDRRRSVLEVGCGTGHWLRALDHHASLLVGVDRSIEMLRRARTAETTSLLVHATAERLPLREQLFDRVFCVNALHHFPDPVGFIAECRRVLRPGGSFLTIGLDPHNGRDQWWIYDYFPEARTADLRRYPPTERIREMLTQAGFTGARSEVVQHAPARLPYDEALAAGLLDRRSTSQLMVISDDAYEAGCRRLAAERPVLRSELRLFGTSADLPNSVLDACAASSSGPRYLTRPRRGER
jgi:SAM-dependent methyltransferase